MNEDQALADILTGHASARFRWLDVRPDAARAAAPMSETHGAVAADRL